MTIKIKSAFLRIELYVLYHICMFKYIKKASHLYNSHIRGHKEEPRFLIITSLLQRLL